MQRGKNVGVTRNQLHHILNAARILLGLLLVVVVVVVVVADRT